MIKFVSILFLFVGYSIQLSAQSSSMDCLLREDSSESEIYIIVDQMPEAFGGNQELHKQLIQHLRLKKDSSVKVGTIRILLSVIISESGQVENEYVVGSNIENIELEQQLLDIISKFKWNPGSCNGKNVSVEVQIPIILDIKP